MESARIAGLFVYPVKGCRGVALEEAALGPIGLDWDRRWLVVRPDGRFMTQRDVPALTGIVPAIEGGQLVLRMGGALHAVGLDEQGPPMEVVIWKDRFSAFTQPPPIDRALSAFLDRPARLVRFDSNVVRLCDPSVSPPGAHAAFSDEFPLLLASAASLDWLNGRLLAKGAPPVPMERFRPNIVVEGLPALAEDHHPIARIGQILLRLVSPCERCIVTTTDQASGLRQGAEPLQTLRQEHADRAGKPLFGWNAVPLSAGNGRAVLRIGASVEFLPRPEDRPDDLPDDLPGWARGPD